GDGCKRVQTSRWYSIGIASPGHNGAVAPQRNAKAGAGSYADEIRIVGRNGPTIVPIAVAVRICWPTYYTPVLQENRIVSDSKGNCLHAGQSERNAQFSAF